MIEKGLTPPDLPNERKTLMLKTACGAGPVMLFLGIGIAVGSFVLSNWTPDRELVWMAGMASAIVGSLGLGNLVYYFLARNRVPKVDTTTR